MAAGGDSRAGPLRRLARDLRRNPSVNLAGARLLRSAARHGQPFRRLPDKWPLHGRIEIEVAGVPMAMLGRGDDSCLDDLFYGRPWERTELAVFRLLAERARTVWDIGANIGVYALLAAKATPRAAVTAVEPHPFNFARLRANLELNPGAAVKAIEAAA